MFAPATSVVVAELVAAKLPVVAIDAKVVSASSNKVMLVPLAVTSPNVTVPGLAMVTEPDVEIRETAPVMLRTSVALLASWIKPTAFKFIVAA